MTIFIERTSLFLAEPSAITSMQQMAIAAHRFNRTFALGLFTALQKNTVTTIVTITARREMEQPMIEMISNAFLWDCSIWENRCTHKNVKGGN